MRKLLKIGLVLTLMITQQVFAQKTVVEVEQNISLSSGIKFVSTRIDLDGEDMLDVLSGVLTDDLDYVQNSDGEKVRKIGPTWVNGIGDWVTIEGYAFKMFDSDILEIAGEPIPVSTPIALSSGYTYISYLPSVTLDAEVAFESIIGDSLIYVKNSDGSMLRKIGPNWVDGIGDCTPGEGFQVSMAGSETLIYPFSCGDVFLDERDDYDDMSYATVEIDDQCWMAENLNVGDQIDADDGGSNADGEQTDNGDIEKYCYNDYAGNCDDYGGLYQWNEMMQYVTTAGTQGICPDGWYIATDEEWETLIDYLGGEDVAGGKMKETGTTHWNSPNTGATNESGFIARGGGYGGPSGFGLFGYMACFSNSTYDAYGVNALYAAYNNDDIDGISFSYSVGTSVRCLKDDSEAKSLKQQTNKPSKLLTGHFVVKGSNPSENIWTLYFEKGILERGDEIGVFNGKTLAGSGLINSDNIFENSVPVFSNLYKTDGEVIIKIWDKSLQKELILSNYSFSDPYGDAYTNNKFPQGDMKYSLINSFKIEKSSTIKTETEISINPNPSEGIFNLSIEDYSGDIQLIITDLQGKEYRNFTMAENSTQFDLSDLTQGVYFVRCVGENFNTVKKIILK